MDQVGDGDGLGQGAGLGDGEQEADLRCIGGSMTWRGKGCQG